MTQILATLDELIQTSRSYDYDKNDYRVLDASKTFFDEGGSFHLDASPLPHDDADWKTKFPAEHASGQLSDHARNQLYDKVASSAFGKGQRISLPTTYLNILPGDVYATNLNWLLSKSDGRWMVRFNRDDNGNAYIRAVVDANYPRTYNTDILAQLSDAIQSRDGLPDLTLDRPFVTPDEMFVRGWWDGTGTGNYRVGFLATNGEIGSRKTGLLPMVWRTTCQNSISVSTISHITGNRAGVEFIHFKGITAASIMVALYTSMPDVLGASAQLVNKMIESEGVALPEFSQILKGLAIEYGWKSEQEDDMLAGTEGEQTVAGIANGLTFMAQQLDNAADTVRYQQAAGDFLYTHQSITQRLIAQGKSGKKVKEVVR